MMVKVPQFAIATRGESSFLLGFPPQIPCPNSNMEEYLIKVSALSWGSGITIKHPQLPKLWLLESTLFGWILA